MNAKVISKEKNTVKFTFNVRAPRKMIEAAYGEAIFYDDALNFVLDTEYPATVKELDLDVVSKPEIDTQSISKEDGVVFEAEVTVKPEVKLGQYKGLEVEKVDTSVPESAVEAELKKVQEQNSRLVTVEDRAAMMGDTATISYK